MTEHTFDLIISDEVASALRDGRGVVALETTIVVHGLPRPTNLEVAAELEDIVRANGSVPATIGVLDGRPIVGLSAGEIERLADPARDVAKLSSRDLGTACALGLDGATTVAGTITLAAKAGISVMATGGLGGVHRDFHASFDESADLAALARTPVMVVASGVKSILDIPATLERLDTLGVPVIGYGTDRFPGFYLHSTPNRLDWSIDSAEDAAAILRAHRTFSGSGILLANPVTQEAQLDEALHDQALAAGLERVQSAGVSGKGVTPLLLSAFAEITGGQSVIVNRALVCANAALAATIAQHYATS